MKTTSNGRGPENIKSVIYKQPQTRSLSKCKLKLRGSNQNKKNVEMKMTYIGRQHQNIKSKLSQQLLIRSSSYFKLKQRGLNQIKRLFKNEDDLPRKTT